MIRSKKHVTWIRLITFMVITIFLCQNVGLANEGTNRNCLAAQSRLTPFFEKYGLGIRNIGKVAMAVSKLKRVIYKDVQGDVEREVESLNSFLLDRRIKIEGTSEYVFKCSQRKIKYAVFNFEESGVVINALFMKEHQKLTPLELKELRIKDKEKHHLDCPGLEGVWFIYQKSKVKHAESEGTRSADSDKPNAENRDGRFIVEVVGPMEIDVWEIAGDERRLVSVIRLETSLAAFRNFNDAKISILPDAGLVYVHWADNNYHYDLHTGRYLREDYIITHFFRDFQDWLGPLKNYLNEIISRKITAKDRILTIKSVGASTGMEVYSYAAVIYQALIEHNEDPAAWNILIEAYDMNPYMKDKIERGIYKDPLGSRLGTMPLSSIRCEFEKAGYRPELIMDEIKDGEWQVKKQIREWIRFFQVNLTEPSVFELLARTKGNIFVCKYTLEYLSKEWAEDVIRFIKEGTWSEEKYPFFYSYDGFDGRIFEAKTVPPWEPIGGGMDNEQVQEFARKGDTTAIDLIRYIRVTRLYPQIEVIRGALLGDQVKLDELDKLLLEDAELYVEVFIQSHPELTSIKDLLVKVSIMAGSHRKQVLDSVAIIVQSLDREEITTEMIYDLVNGIKEAGSDSHKMLIDKSGLFLQAMVLKSKPVGSTRLLACEPTIGVVIDVMARVPFEIAIYRKDGMWIVARGDERSVYISEDEFPQITSDTIVAHNHPNGIPIPSPQDLLLLQKGGIGVIFSMPPLKDSTAFIGLYTTPEVNPITGKPFSTYDEARTLFREAEQRYNDEITALLRTPSEDILQTAVRIQDITERYLRYLNIPIYIHTNLTTEEKDLTLTQFIEKYRSKIKPLQEDESGPLRLGKTGDNAGFSKDGTTQSTVSPGRDETTVPRASQSVSQVIFPIDDTALPDFKRFRFRKGTLFGSRWDWTKESPYNENEAVHPDYYHKGIDIFEYETTDGENKSMSVDTPVRAICDGEVVLAKAGEDEIYIKTTDNRIIRYGHIQSLVNNGDHVRKGDIIGRFDTPRFGIPSYLHLEILEGSYELLVPIVSVTDMSSSQWLDYYLDRNKEINGKTSHSIDPFLLFNEIEFPYVIEDDDTQVRPSTLHNSSSTSANYYINYIDKNRLLFQNILDKDEQDVLLRIPVEVIESVNIENIKDFLSALQAFSNLYIELYYISNITEVKIDLYQRYGLTKKSLPNGFVKTRENTITLFAASKDEELTAATVLNRLGEIGLAPTRTILSPVGLQNDRLGLLRSIILGLRLLSMARQKIETGKIDDDFIDETVKQYKEICQDNEFNITGGDLIDIATGDINRLIKALKKIINLLPVNPIIEDDLREIYEHATNVLTAA